MNSSVRVSVITRTFDRPMFVERCHGALTQSLSAKDEWLVIDDMETPSAETKQLIDKLRSESEFSVVYYHSGSKNRAKALNFGIEKVAGNYLHVLDDDDTIAPSFHGRMVAFLEQADNRHYGAAACLSERIDEEIDAAGSAKVVSRKPHYPELKWISFASLATSQKTPTCSLLFRRDAFGDLRADEDFDFAEDHDLLLRFLAREDIAVVREALAFFHHRPTAKGASANSAISLETAKEAARFRNAMMRRDLKSGTVGLGWLLTMAEMQLGASRLNHILDRLYAMPLINKVYQKLRR